MTTTMSVPGPGDRPVANPVQAEVFEAADGLVVYELPWETGTWVVGLASHGWRIDDSSWHDRATATACAKALEPLADWHANPMDLGATTTSCAGRSQR